MCLQGIIEERVLAMYFSHAGRNKPELYTTSALRQWGTQALSSLPWPLFNNVYKHSRQELLRLCRPAVQACSLVTVPWLTGGACTCCVDTELRPIS